MDHDIQPVHRRSIPVKTIAVTILSCCFVFAMAHNIARTEKREMALNKNPDTGTAAPDDEVHHRARLATDPVADKVNPDPRAKKDSAASVKAFMEVYSVLMSPRCMNCHPSGDVPLQGDESLLHTMAPQRGKDGKGVFAMKCANCHQPENTPGLHTPPGNPEWHLPPADMKMVFQGKTARQLARQLVNPATNGNKTMKQLLEHASDTLVIAGWNPGEGRTLPPLSYDEFKKAWFAWIENGAFAPK